MSAQKIYEEWSRLSEKWDVANKKLTVAEAEVRKPFFEGNAVAGYNPSIEQLKKVESLRDEVNVIKVGMDDCIKKLKSSHL